MGTSGDYAPFSQGVGETLRGFDVDVAERFAADTGHTIVWVPFRWPDLMASFEAGRFDVVMSGVTVRPERSVRGRFSLPVVETGAVVLVRDAAHDARVGEREDALEALDDASLRLAVNAGGHLERVTRARFRSARIRAIPSNEGVREALAAGEVDAVVTDGLEAPHWLEGLEGVRAVGPFTRDRKAYWVAADAPDLARELDAWLLERESDATLAELRARWFPADARGRTSTPLEALLAACDERLALMPSVAEFKRETGAAIVDPEREARVIEAGRAAVAAAAAERGVPAPPRAAVDSFYRAQIDAAVSVQRRVRGGPTRKGELRFDLGSELRPALLRIGERMAWLLARIADDPTAAPPLEPRVARALSRHSLPASAVRAIAASLERIAAARTGE